MKRSIWLPVVQSRVEGRAQQVKIEGAASIGTLAGEIGSTFSVQASLYPQIASYMRSIGQTPAYTDFIHGVRQGLVK